MIDEHGIYAISAVIYAIAAAAYFGLTRRQPQHLRRYCYLLVGVVVAAAILSAIFAVGIGTVAVAGGEVIVPQMIDGLIAYPLLFGFAVFTAGSSRSVVALIAGVSIAQRLAYEVGALTDGLLGLAMLLVVVGGYFVHVYLLFGPVWRTASRQSPRRRLLFWKFRNLLLFLIGMLIVAALLSLTPLLDPFTGSVAVQYVDVLLRVGFAGFLIGNISALDSVTEDATDRAEWVTADDVATAD